MSALKSKTENNAVIVYVRHADKEYDNGKCHGDQPAFDPDIKEDQIEISINFGKHLVKLYGEPNLILVSPFRRTRRTAECMLDSIDVKDTCLAIDENVSEYLGHQSKVVLQPKDFDPETLLLTTPDNHENMDDLDKRLREHIEYVNLHTKTHKVIWVITHGLCINKIARILSYNKRLKKDPNVYERTKHVSPLDGMIITKQYLTTIPEMK